MFRILLLLACGWALGACTPALPERRATLEHEIRTIVDSVRATVGVAAVFGPDDTLAIRPDAAFPMASVYKFHQALAVLDSLDRAALSLNTPIRVRPSDLHPDTWSPLRKARPEGGYELPMAELLAYSVALSDNNACDLLFRFLGSPRAADRYMVKLGLGNTVIATDEQAMHAAPCWQYLNRTSPLDAVRLLERFRRGELLSARNTEFLMRTMLATATGPNKLKGLLPRGVRVAHKTGNGFRNEHGIMGAENDIGIVFLPDGRAYSIAVFVTDSQECDSLNEAIIARISRCIYDYFSEPALQ
ncbi:MAG: class A beta-lactamase [Alistipes sp.]|nr:class A beta-lactamase [Alistipes sp.]